VGGEQRRLAPFLGGEKRGRIKKAKGGIKTESGGTISDKRAKKTIRFIRKTLGLECWGKVRGSFGGS